MTNKFVIIFIFLAGIFITGFGAQKVQAGCTEYWDCPTNNYCDICDPPKTKDSGSCVSNGTPHRSCNPVPDPKSGGGTPPVPAPVPNPASCTHTGNCETCGAPNQGQCGVGDNSDTCNCNPPGNSPCDSNAESNGAGGCRAKSGAPPPPPPAPAAKTKPPNSCTGECHCGSSSCGDYIIEDGVNKVCARGVDNGYPTWKCDAGVWIPTSPKCDSVNYDQPTGRTKTVAGENSGCLQKEMKNECGQTQWGDDTTDNCPATPQKICPGSSVFDCSTAPGIDPNYLCYGKLTRVCYSGTWGGYSPEKCDCRPKKYRWDDGYQTCILDMENGTYDTQEICQKANEPPPPAPVSPPTPAVTKTTPFCKSSSDLCFSNDPGGCVPCAWTNVNGEMKITTCQGDDGDAKCLPPPAPVSPPAPIPETSTPPKLAPYCLDGDTLCMFNLNGACGNKFSCKETNGNGSRCDGPDGKATCVPPPSSQGVVVKGTVTGSIISNALITFFAGDKKVQEVTTDSVGNFSLTLDQKAIEENTEFVITVEKQGYKTFKTTWRPGQGVSYFMQIQLEKGDLKDNGGQANINAQGVSYQLDAGWNFVSINLQSEINTAKKLTDEVNRQGGQVIFISRWLGDRWESYVPNAGSADFAIEAGKSYMIKVGKKSEFTLSGNPQKDSSTTTVEKGWNAVSFPLLEKQTVTADGKLKALNGSTISRFSSGLWDTYARLGNPIQIYGNDYELDSRQGYFVKVE